MIGQGSMPALGVSFATETPAGLTIGPNGELYVAAGDVYRLGAGGILHLVVGEHVSPKGRPKSWKGVYSNPAVEFDFSQAERLAFDGKGDLLVAGGVAGDSTRWRRAASSASSRSSEATASGARLPSRPEKAWSYPIDLGSPGSHRRARSRRSVLLLSGLPPPLSMQRWGAGEEAPNRTSSSGSGAAVDTNGDIYVDTNTGNTWTSVTAILELQPDGRATAIWKS